MSKDRLVYRVSPGHPENTEKKERPVSMEKMEIPEIRGFLDLPVTEANLERTAPREFKESPGKKDHREIPEDPAYRDTKDHRGNSVTRVFLDLRVLEDDLDLLDPWDLLVNPAPEEDAERRESPENLVSPENWDPSDPKDLLDPRGHLVELDQWASPVSPVWRANLVPQVKGDYLDRLEKRSWLRVVEAAPRVAVTRDPLGLWE